MSMLSTLQEVNLAITKTAAASSVLIGSETSFLITAINQGDSTASGVTVRDILPGGLDFATPLPQSGLHRLGSDPPADSADSGCTAPVRHPLRQACYRGTEPLHTAEAASTFGIFI